VSESCYLRYPHVAGDLLTFTAEDDVWLASLSEAAGRGTRARRLTSDKAPLLHPRLNPSATHVAWTSTRDGARSASRRVAREAYAVSVDGGPVRRLTYWGDRFATVRGWVSDGEALVLSRAGQHFSMKTWAFAVPLSGPARRLGYGPAGDVAVRDGAVLVGSAMNFEPAEPAQWKGYRGGAGGKIWYSPDGSHYTRILAGVGDNLVNPMFVGSRVVFLSDHEGTGALYSALPDGTDLRRHTGLGPYYARHATTDGRRVVYQRAGELWLLESLDAEPARLDIRLGGAGSGRAPYPVSAASQLGSFTLDSAGGVLGAPTWTAWTGPLWATATGRCSTASAPRTTCTTCCGSSRARWAARTPGWCRLARAVTPRWLRACSAPTSSPPGTAPGGSRGSCPVSRR
jgi:tricorn protease